MNHNLLTQKTEKRKCIQYYNKKAKLIARVIEDFRNNTTEKGAIFPQRCFMHKISKKLGPEGRDSLTKDMD